MYLIPTSTMLDYGGVLMLAHAHWETKQSSTMVLHPVGRDGPISQHFYHPFHLPNYQCIMFIFFIFIFILLKQARSKDLLHDIFFITWIINFLLLKSNNLCSQCHSRPWGKLIKSFTKKISWKFFTYGPRPNTLILAACHGHKEKK